MNVIGWYCKAVVIVEWQYRVNCSVKYYVLSMCQGFTIDDVRVWWGLRVKSGLIGQ